MNETFCRQEKGGNILTKQSQKADNGLQSIFGEGREPTNPHLQNIIKYIKGSGLETKSLESCTDRHLKEFCTLCMIGQVH
jgi:hypothetical protein